MTVLTTAIDRAHDGGTGTIKCTACSSTTNIDSRIIHITSKQVRHISVTWKLIYILCSLTTATAKDRTVGDSIILGIETCFTDRTTKNGDGTLTTVLEIVGISTCWCCRPNGTISRWQFSITTCRVVI